MEKETWVTVTRKAHFNAAHKIENPTWSPEKNQEVFGKCANPNFHGHNYGLEVSVTGPVNPETGYVVDLKRLADLIQMEVEDRFDHKNLNLDTEEFRGLLPSAENIAIVIYCLLKKHFPDPLKLHIRLYETERNFVDYPARN